MAKVRVAYLISGHNRFLRNVFPLSHPNIELDYLAFKCGGNDFLNLCNSGYIKKNSIDVEKIHDMTNKSEDDIVAKLNEYDVLITGTTYAFWGIFGKNVFNRLNKNIVTIFIPHGVEPMSTKEVFLSKTDSKEVIGYMRKCVKDFDPNFYLLSCCLNTKMRWVECAGFSENKFIKIDTIPQFDLNQKYFDDENTNLDDTILIFTPDLKNISNPRTPYWIDMLKRLFTIITKYYPEKKLILNLKKENPAFIEKYFMDFTNLTVTSSGTNYQEPISRYIKCYATIVVAGSTVFYEHMLVKNRVFLFNNLPDNTDVRESTKIPIKINKLLVSENYDEFEERIKSSTDENYFDNEFEKEKMEFITLHRGNANKVTRSFGEEFSEILLERDFDKETRLSKKQKLIKPE